MPAVDQCEPAVIRAFEKAGWVITDQPYTLEFEPSRYLYADVRFVQGNEFVLITEVKCFHDTQPFWDSFYQAVGQYAVYRAIIELANLDEPLYLAIPVSAHEIFVSTDVLMKVIADFGVRIVVIDTEREEIISWMI